jgi:hypothetical protein
VKYFNLHKYVFIILEKAQKSNKDSRYVIKKENNYKRKYEIKKREELRLVIRTIGAVPSSELIFSIPRFFLRDSCRYFNVLKY